MARTMAEPDRLDALVERLERTAAELRTGELSTERAARWSTTARASPPRPAPSSTAAYARRTPGHGVAGQLALES